MKNDTAPRTNSEKLVVLKNARNLLNIGHAKQAWFNMIDGVESYCLYGAVEEAMGLNVKKRVYEDAEEFYSSEDEQIESVISQVIDQQEFIFIDDDVVVDECSLTSTMFQAWLDSASDARIEFWRKGSLHKQNAYGAAMGEVIGGYDYGQVFWMRHILQQENDYSTKEAILAVVDKAIENLEALVAAE